MPTVPRGKARQQFLKSRVPVGPLVARPKLARAHEGAPLTAEAKANLAKLRAQARIYFPGLHQG
jgi:hypothetical protein